MFDGSGIRTMLLLFCTVVALGGCGSAEEIEVQAVSTTENGIAVSGYDVVSYFDGTAQVGSPDYTHVWKGATFQFVSEGHRDTFAKSPAQYAPQYGGYCSFGMGFGQLAAADPEAYVVQDGKLHLNASPMVRRFWRWFGNAEKSAAKWRELLIEAGIQ